MSIQLATPLTEELEALVVDYRQWLVVERSLTPDTVKYRVRVARRFLSECAGKDLKSLGLGEVIDFLMNQSSGLAVKTAKGLATALAFSAGLSVPERRHRHPAGFGGAGAVGAARYEPGPGGSRPRS